MNKNIDLELNKPLNKEVAKRSKDLLHINRTKQYLAALSVCLAGFSGGTVTSWTSPALDYLLEEGFKRNHTIPGFTISTSEEAVVSSIINLSALIFGTPSGKLADFFGRKKLVLAALLFYLINFVLIGFAKNVYMLIIARILAGFSLGVSFTVGPMYIGEIADNSTRGTLGSLINTSIVLGLLYTNVVGGFTNWIGLTVALSIFPVVSIISLLFLPESPVYLVSIKKLEKAKESLLFYRNNKALAYEELTLLQKESVDHTEKSSIIDFLTKKCYRKVMIAGVGVFCLQQLSGICVVVYYTVPIFNSAGGSIDPAYAAIITNLVSFLMGLLSVFIIEKRSRKFFLLLSTFMMMVSLIGLGFFFQLQSLKVNFPGLQYLPVSILMLFMVGYNVGIGPVPFILITEYYGPEVRGIAAGSLLAVSWASTFVSIYTYPILRLWVGTYFTFYFYAMVNLFGIGFVKFCMPETKTQN